VVGGAALVLVLATEPEETEAREPPGDSPTMTGEIEVVSSAVRRRDIDVAAVSPRVELGLRPRPSVELNIAIGAAALFANGTAGPIRAGAPSNAIIGGRFVAARTCTDCHRTAAHIGSRRNARSRYRAGHIGFQFALPTAPSSTEEMKLAVEYAQVGRAGWNPWEWETGVLGLVVPAGVRVQAARRLVLGGDAAVALLVPTTDTRGVTFAGQLAFDARVVLSRLALGMRLAGVWNGRDVDDRTHASVAPFVDIGLCRRGSGPRVRGTIESQSSSCPLRASARLNINLDGPYGFATGDPMGVWGVVVGLGWSVW
jgi:hypothetical protein